MTSMVSPWVTVALGVLTVLGTLGGALGGQFIAARTAEKTANRAIANDELRWTRDQERHRDDRTHDLLKHWSEQRFEAYSQCLTAFETWLDVLKDELDELRAADGDDALGLRNKAAHAAVREAVDRVHVIGSDDSIQAALMTYRDFHRYHHRIDIGNESGWMPDEPAMLREQFEAVLDTFKAMRTTFRRDFGFGSS
ncbi:hypothetical protein [Amycolatopsis sp. cmx-11-51]|uniref:hypothetical protein n=1 Tax=Amycolatopsis sp. cmx-11-51 TaxID=2785797 RepID=UPI0039E34290